MIAPAVLFFLFAVIRKERTELITKFQTNHFAKLFVINLDLHRTKDEITDKMNGQEIVSDREKKEKKKNKGRKP